MSDTMSKNEIPEEKLVPIGTRQSNAVGEVDNADSLQRHLGNRQIQLMYNRQFDCESRTY